jgi:hypothetical protein
MIKHAVDQRLMSDPRVDKHGDPHR